MSGEINWGEPIEAYHTDGRVVAAFLVKHDHDDPDLPALVAIHGLTDTHWVGQSGRVRRLDWTIRNVAQAPETGSTAPSGGEVGPEVGVWVTSDVNVRMEALCRSMTHGLTETGGVYPSLSSMDHYHEARAIVALLPEPVDADEAEAAKIAQGMIYGNDDSVSHDRIVRLLKDAIKRGRALEKGEAA